MTRAVSCPPRPVFHAQAKEKRVVRVQGPDNPDYHKERRPDSSVRSHEDHQCHLEGHEYRA